MSPSVSVCIPAYNSAAYIGRTIESVLAQTFEDFELIVVDDQSSDGTADAACAFDDPRLRVLVNDTNLGAVGNWNRALGLTQGEFVKLVCGDDVLYPTCLERQVAALTVEPRASMAAAKRDVIDARDKVLFRRRGLGRMSGFVDGPVAIRAVVRAGTNPFGEPFCVLMRRDAVDRCGGFQDRRYVIDLDYWVRLLEVGGLVAVTEPLGAFRVVDTSWSARIGKDQRHQTVELLAELRHSFPDMVSARDLRRGMLAARTQAMARLVLYRLLRF